MKFRRNDEPQRRQDAKGRKHAKKSDSIWGLKQEIELATDGAPISTDKENDSWNSVLVSVSIGTPSVAKFS
jgi:hypothetical protein